MMIVLGLTGGLATGKTTVSNIFSELGYPVVSADEISHNLLLDPIIKQKLVKIFGDDILDRQNNINRTKLGQIVFNDIKYLKKLEHIMNPIIKKKIIEIIEYYKKKSDGLVVIEIPLLFEKGYQDLVDNTMVVTTTSNQQLSRLIKRDKLSESDSKKRIALQMDLKIKSKLAETIIDNSCDVKYVKQQIMEWLKSNKIQK